MRGNWGSTTGDVRGNWAPTTGDVRGGTGRLQRAM